MTSYLVIRCSDSGTRYLVIHFPNIGYDVYAMGERRVEPYRVVMEITHDTRVITILDHYGDIAEIMELFGVHRAGPLGFRRVLARFLTVRRAARVHRVPLDNFMTKLREATARADAARAAGMRQGNGR